MSDADKTDWNAYARVPQDAAYFAPEPVQEARIAKIVERVKGSVLDVGGADGYIAQTMREQDHQVDLVDISSIRVARATRAGLSAFRADACALPFENHSYDTVVLGEVMEHLENPGLALGEACRIARERVVCSLPLNGWTDPTHRWRISLDVLEDPHQRTENATRGQQIVLTFQRGECWPPGYHLSDARWREQFGEPN
jgi:ubiquinone/menaquinone biosynthesis C-methylase UbiE